jgi:hypothetical protein
MSEYIELSTITPSSSEESVFNQPSTSTGVRRRGGYVSIPINSSNSSISSAGSDSKLRVPNTPRVGGAVLEQVANINQYSKGNWEEQQLTLGTLYREQYLVIETITTEPFLGN